MSERARHTGDGMARRKAHQERQRDEREQREEADRAAGTALPPEEGGVELVSADDVLKGVAETGPNYTLLPKRERKAKRRRRRRAAAEASGESASEDGMDGLHEAAAATARATGRPCRATRGSGSMREASDSEWELIDVGGETEYWDTRVGGDENYLGEGAFRWRRCGASGAASPALSSTRSNGRATRRTRTPGRRRRTCLPISSRSGTGSERQRQREARHARGGGRRSGGGWHELRWRGHSG